MSIEYFIAGRIGCRKNNSKTQKLLTDTANQQNVGVQSYRSYSNARFMLKRFLGINKHCYWSTLAQQLFVQKYFDSLMYTLRFYLKRRMFIGVQGDLIAINLSNQVVVLRLSAKIEKALLVFRNYFENYVVPHLTDMESL